MGEQSPTVAWQKVDRMILVYLLVLVYSLRGCLGVHRSPEAVWEPQDIVGNLGLLTKFSDNEFVSASSSRGYDPSKQLVTRDVLDNELDSVDQDNQTRELSLKMLLENLAKLRNLKGRQIKASQTARTAGNTNRRGQYRLSGKQIRISPLQTQHIYPPEFLPRYNGDFRLRNERVQSNTRSDILLPSSGEDHKQLPSARRAEVFYNLNNRLYTDLVVLREPIPSENKDVQTNQNDFHKRTVHKEKEKLNVYDSKSKKVMKTDGGNSLEFVKDERNKISYLFTPVNYLTGKDDAEPLNSYDTTLNAAKSKFVDNTANQHGELWSEVNTIKTHDDLLSKNIDTVNSLIFKAVKKMEGIVNKRVYQYDTFLTTVQQLPDETSEIIEDDSPSNENSTWLNENEHLAPVDNTESDELLVPDNAISDEDAGNVIKEVIKAVADRKVPKDIRFWQKLSHYLDSSDYRRRAKRSPERRRHKGHRYVHLSITYGHVMPCEHKDRFYCMNGGTCVFVGALDIRTCRCPIGYTGVRCELIDQEYILSLLTNTLIFS